MFRQRNAFSSSGFFFEWRPIKVIENFSSLFHFIICNVASWNYFCMFPSLLLFIYKSIACWARRCGSNPRIPQSPGEILLHYFHEMKSSSWHFWTISFIIRASCFHLLELCMPVLGNALRAILFETLTKTCGQLDIRRYLLILVELNCNFCL